MINNQLRTIALLTGLIMGDLVAPGSLQAQQISGYGYPNTIPVFNSSNSISPSILFQSNSNIGVGTNAPAYKLHVLGGAIGGNYGLTPAYTNWFAYGAGDGGAAIYNDNNTFKKLMIVGNTAAGGVRQVGIYDNLTVHGSSTVEGNLGIGTPTPSGKLEVNGRLVIANPGSMGPLGSGSLLSFSSGQSDVTAIQENWGLNLNGSVTAPVKVTNTSLLVGYTSSGVDYGKGNLYTSGSVGIGTTNTSGVKLQVVGAGGFNTDLKVNGRIQTGDGQNYGGVWVNNMFMGQEGTSQIGFYNNNAWRLVVNDAGNVGIGTITPDAAFKLSVNGSIRAKEIKVSTAWSDYVFYSNYRLRPLAEVESYIQQHQHLPEVPSAEEVEKNGINLGETDALLLKKIEELTLYMIEQNKKIQALEAQVLKLSKD